MLVSHKHLTNLFILRHLYLMNPATALLVAQLVPAAIAAGKELFELYDAMRGDPEARCEALKQLNEQCKVQHEESMEKLKNSQKEYEAAAQKREDESNARLKLQREENLKQREMLQAALEKQNQKHDDDLKAMNEMHSKKMQEMRMETKEKKDTVEMEHRIRMAKLEEEFKKEKNSAEEKLSHAKKEGEEKLKIVEKEKNECIEQRDKELHVFLDVAKKLNDLQNGEVKKIREMNRQFREENMILRREQNQVENKAKLDTMKQSYNSLLESLVSNNSRNVIQQFQKVAEHVVTVQTSLGHIKNDCLPSHGGAPTIVPGRLDEDFRSITSAMNGFKHCKKLFRQYIISTNHTDRNLLESLNGLLNNMDRQMGAQELSELCSQLPLTLGKERLGCEDLRVIKFYAENSNAFFQNFSELSSYLDLEVQNIHLNHLPTASEKVTPAITQ